MDNEEIVYDDTQNIVANEESFEESTFQDPEQVDSFPEADTAELERKNRELYARAKKAEDELKQFKSKPQESNQNNPSEFATKQELERFVLLQKYDEDVVSEIMSLGGQKALDNPLVKSGIEAMQAKKRSESATPDTSSRSPIFKKFTEAELQAMPVEEMEKLLRKNQ